MVATHYTCLSYSSTRLTYTDACQLAVKLASCPRAQVVRLDLQGTQKTTTGALARLVQLRAALLNNGGDMFVSGLQGRVKGLYEIHGMHRLLPQP